MFEVGYSNPTGSYKRERDGFLAWLMQLSGRVLIFLKTGVMLV
jgi:hypothetical protein